MEPKEIGQKVCYTGGFMRSCGMYTMEFAAFQGVITAIDNEIAVVNEDGKSRRVNIHNLMVVGTYDRTT